MGTIFYYSDVETPVKLDIEPIQIKPISTFPDMEDAEPAGDQFYFRPFANEKRNSRNAYQLKGKYWKTGWKVELKQGFPAQFVLFSRQSILLQQTESWQMFNFDGKAIKLNARSDGDIILDRKAQLLYYCDFNGMISAADLSTGEEKFSIIALFGQGFSRSIFPDLKNRITIVSQELPFMTAEEIREPEFTLIEIYDLGGSRETDEDGILASASEVAKLICRPFPLIYAMYNDTMVLAAQDHIYLVNKDLKITADLQGIFIPLTMSLDERGHIYLVVKNNEDQFALWILDQNGGKYFETEIVADPETEFLPPVVGFDHSIYVLSEAQIFAYNKGGTNMWNQKTGGHIGGAVITADNQLLVSEGNGIFVYNQAGERSVVQYIEDEEFVTPPVLTPHGRILVATQQNLYSYETR